MENTIDSDLLASEKLSFDKFREEVLNDYRQVCESRETSLLGRKEVLTGKAKFGIFGDGKEVPQVAMAKFFKPGDFYSGYYRDQTFAFSSGTSTIEEFFSQLYADPDHDPHSSGRNMNAHFASAFVDKGGEFLDLVNRKNIAAGLAPTAAQMPRALGFAFASKLFRGSEVLSEYTALSNHGNEVCFCTIGDSSTSEGHFWEVINAAGVLQVPLAIFVWDDGYGISVPKELQTTKGSVSEALRGFQKKEGTNGIDIYTVKAWDYSGMCEVFEAGIRKTREKHIPALFHVEEVTQPQGHSTSGSHERYKTQERLAWEREWDCIRKMKEWITDNELATEEELAAVEAGAKQLVRKSRNNAWDNYFRPVKQQVGKTVELLSELARELPQHGSTLKSWTAELTANREPNRKDVIKMLHQSAFIAGSASAGLPLKEYYQDLKNENSRIFNSYLYNEGPRSALKVPVQPAIYEPDAPQINGYEILNRYFDQLFAHNQKVVALGEDVGYIGDVNQGFAGLQSKYGANRIFDTGIRELSIMGQGIGLALRGLRPITEIQYLDYVLYGLQPLSDDLATLHYRTAGRQSAPLIVRTRGHRLEGIWHSGSPMGVLLSALRGLYVCVPRNMVQAAGMYNTLLQAHDPAIMVECLNGYRLKELLPSNLSAYTVPLGVPEIVQEGTDITLVSYGATLRIVQEAAAELENTGIYCEVIDVQTLLPFDLHYSILTSLKKTSRLAIIDEDVPGGASAYIFNKIMEEQGGYRWLDAAPRTLTAQAHRPAYASDGDYFSKPNVEDVITVVREMMAE